MHRIDKILSHMGYGSRKEVKALIKSGAVIVNGNLVKDVGTHVDPEHDLIVVHGEQVKYQPFIYIMMNKPQGVISATEDLRDRTVIDLLHERFQHYRPFPVGRLDKDTEGLLLITNDGKLAHNLLSPRKFVDKTYYVEVHGQLKEEMVEQFQQGVMLDDGYVTLPAELNILETGAISRAEVTIREGKYHQVKRMFRAVHCEVSYLKRIRMGPIVLDASLSAGEYRELTDEEIQRLRDT